MNLLQKIKTLNLEILGVIFAIGLMVGWSINFFIVPVSNGDCLLTKQQAIAGAVAQGITSGPMSVCLEFKKIPK